MALAVLITAIVFYGTAGQGGAPVAKRIHAMAVADLIVVAWLALLIGNMARLRFLSPEDIAGSGLTNASGRLRVSAAVLQNTVEQVVLAVPVYGLLAMVRADSAMLLVVSAGLFSLGRLLFWIGYAKGAAARALEFALTFYPTVAGLFSVAATLAR